MLPEHYYLAEHIDGQYSEAKWLAEQLDELTIAQQRFACKAYSKIFLEEGRSAANARMREFRKNCDEIKHGKTSPPPKATNYE